MNSLVMIQCNPLLCRKGSEVQLFPETIKINGNGYYITALFNEKSEVLPKEAIRFLKEWYNEKEHIVVQTSGSAGKPKKIPLRKTFIAASARRTLDFFQLQKGDAVLLCLPVRYIAGKLMIVRALLGGLDLHPISPEDDFSFLQEQGVEFRLVAMVTNQVQKLLSMPESFLRIGTLLIGGSALPESLETALQKVTCRCYISYGMTETATHIALRRINGATASSFYQPFAGITLSLLPEGRLVIAMPGLKRPLITNDLVQFAENNRDFKVLGRADNIIISGGIKYIPEELEKKLDSAIRYPFFITSLPDDILGSKIVLAVEALADGELRQTLNAAIKQKLPRYQRPKEIIFKEEFLRTATGKIRRVL